MEVDWRAKKNCDKRNFPEIGINVEGYCPSQDMSSEGPDRLTRMKYVFIYAKRKLVLT